MEAPVRVHFREMQHDQALVDQVHERVEKLKKTGEAILACNVSISATTHRNQPLYAVHARVETPHGEVVASKEEQRDHDHSVPNIAVRDAMDAIHRQLLERRKKQVNHRDRGHHGD